MSRRQNRPGADQRGRTRRERRGRVPKQRKERLDQANLRPASLVQKGEIHTSPRLPNRMSSWLVESAMDRPVRSTEVRARLSGYRQLGYYGVISGTSQVNAFASCHRTTHLIARSDAEAEQSTM